MLFEQWPHAQPRCTMLQQGLLQYPMRNNNGKIETKIINEKYTILHVKLSKIEEGKNQCLECKVWSVQ